MNLLTTTTPAPTTAPSRTDDGDDDDLLHVYCCDVNRALCGTDITNHAMTDLAGGPDECAVCLDLAPLACQVCGA